MQSNELIIRELFEAMERVDWAAIEAHPGLADLRQNYPMMVTAFPDMRHTVDHIFSNGENVSWITTTKGTHLGHFMNVAPTGKPVHFMTIGINTVRDGKIVEHWGIPDMFSLMFTLGLTMQPAEASTTQ